MESLLHCTSNEATIGGDLFKKAVLNIVTYFAERHLCRSFFLIKETPTHMSSCIFCKIFKNVYFEEYMQTTPSDLLDSCFGIKILKKTETARGVLVKEREGRSWEGKSRFTFLFLTIAR